MYSEFLSCQPEIRLHSGLQASPLSYKAGRTSILHMYRRDHPATTAALKKIIIIMFNFVRVCFFVGQMDWNLAPCGG